jgi:hypothetical protein
MGQVVQHREGLAGPDTLGEDFALIAEAFADAFRGLLANSTADCRRSTIHYAGWR